MSARAALLANAAFSGVSGVALAVVARPIASLLGVDAAWVLVAIGVGLVGFAAQLVATARATPIDPDRVKLVIGADLAWVVASAALVAWGPLAPAGEALVVAVAAVVLGFAVLQASAIRRPDRGSGSSRTSSTLAALVAAGALGSVAPAVAQEPVLSPMPVVEELRVLPPSSEPAIDRLLAELEQAYAAKDVEAFVSLFTEDFEQVDVNRRVRVRGREAWRRQTARVNAAHRYMERAHHGRARVADDWIVVEVTWTGTVRGAVLGEPGEDRAYDYDGVGLLRIEDGRIGRQILWADFRTLWEQLGDVVAR